MGKNTKKCGFREREGGKGTMNKWTTNLDLIKKIPSENEKNSKKIIYLCAAAPCS